MNRLARTVLPNRRAVFLLGSQDKRRELQMEIAQKFKIPGLSGLKFYPVVITSFEVTIRGVSLIHDIQMPRLKDALFVLE